MMNISMCCFVVSDCGREISADDGLLLKGVWDRNPQSWRGDETVNDSIKQIASLNPCSSDDVYDT
jgi:hypothetical protein